MPCETNETVWGLKLESGEATLQQRVKVAKSQEMLKLSLHLPSWNNKAQKRDCRGLKFTLLCLNINICPLELVKHRGRGYLFFYSDVIKSLLSYTGPLWWQRKYLHLPGRPATRLLNVFLHGLPLRPQQVVQAAWGECGGRKEINGAIVVAMGQQQSLLFTEPSKDGIFLGYQWGQKEWCTGDQWWRGLKGEQI